LPPRIEMWFHCGWTIRVLRKKLLCGNVANGRVKINSLLSSRGCLFFNLPHKQLPDPQTLHGRFNGDGQDFSSSRDIVHFSHTPKHHKTSSSSVNESNKGDGRVHLHPAGDHLLIGAVDAKDLTAQLTKKLLVRKKALSYMNVPMMRSHPCPIE